MTLGEELSKLKALDEDVNQLHHHHLLQMRLHISVNLKQYPLTFLLGFYVRDQT